jgi:molybdenum cofactor cytidylyltransferase
MPDTCAAIVLAAGAGSRYTGAHHKLTAPLPESGPGPALSVIERALASVLAADIGPVIVVTGAAVDIVPAHLAGRVTIRHNDRWTDGQITSLRAGLEAAGDLGCTTAVVGLADQPFVTPAAWRAVATAAGPIAVATYDGQRANPVKLDTAVWPLLPTTGDEGARALMRVRPDLVREVPCTGSPADIDTEEDLRRWQNN